MSLTQEYQKLKAYQTQREQERLFNPLINSLAEVVQWKEGLGADQWTEQLLKELGHFMDGILGVSLFRKEEKKMAAQRHFSERVA